LRPYSGGGNGCAGYIRAGERGRILPANGGATGGGAVERSGGGVVSAKIPRGADVGTGAEAVGGIRAGENVKKSDGAGEVYPPPIETRSVSGSGPATQTRGSTPILIPSNL
jgi:hypothetical protein